MRVLVVGKSHKSHKIGIPYVGFWTLPCWGPSASCTPRWLERKAASLKLLKPYGGRGDLAGSFLDIQSFIFIREPNN